ncbi:MAG: carbon starvation CstA family protein, partial [bacterium]
RLTGPAGRAILLNFILFYILIITGVFVYFIANFFNIFPGTVWATLGVYLTGMLVGHLLYKRHTPIMPVTLLSLVLTAASIYAGMVLRWPAKEFLGGWTIPFWAAVTCVILYLGATLPLPMFIQPVNFVAFFPTFLAIIFIIVGAMVSPLTHVTLQQPAFKTFFDAAAGPMWPILFIAIACGAISGWHSLVGSSSTSKQLDVETDAHPVGAGAMLTEGLLALASLAAYMVLSNDQLKGMENIGAWVVGAVRLTSSYLGGAGAEGLWRSFYAMALVLYALTVLTLAVRFWRLVAAEVFSDGPLQPLGNKYISTVGGLVISYIFSISGSWINLWLYFGASNQLLAGLALMLITIHLARVKAPTIYTLIPAVFMIVTTIAGLLWQIYKFADATLIGLRTGAPPAAFVKPPLDHYPHLAIGLNAVFVLVGIALLVLGLRMAVIVIGGYQRAQEAAKNSPAPSA